MRPIRLDSTNILRNDGHMNVHDDRLEKEKENVYITEDETTSKSQLMNAMNKRQLRRHKRKCQLRHHATNIVHAGEKAAAARTKKREEEVLPEDKGSQLSRLRFFDESRLPSRMTSNTSNRNGLVLVGSLQANATDRVRARRAAATRTKKREEELLPEDKSSQLSRSKFFHGSRLPSCMSPRNSKYSTSTKGLILIRSANEDSTSTENSVEYFNNVSFDSTFDSGYSSGNSVDLSMSMDFLQKAVAFDYMHWLCGDSILWTIHACNDIDSSINSLVFPVPREKNLSNSRK